MWESLRGALAGARNLEKHLAWAEVLTPLVAARLGTADAELRAAVLVQASLGCFDVAITRWSVTDEPAPALLRRTFDTLRDAV